MQAVHPQRHSPDKHARVVVHSGVDRLDSKDINNLISWSLGGIVWTSTRFIDPEVWPAVCEADFQRSGSVTGEMKQSCVDEEEPWTEGSRGASQSI